VLGGAVDRAIEVVLRERWAALGDGRPGAIPPGRLEACYGEAWRTRTEAEGPIDWRDGSALATFADGVNVVTSPAVLETLSALRLSSGRGAGGDGDGPALQHRIELRVPGVPVPVIGFIDAVAGSEDGRTTTIVDFKVTRRRWPAGKVRGELQPRIYVAALRQRGLPLASLRFRYVIFVRSPLPESVVVQTIDVDLAEADIYVTLDLLRDAWRQIEAGVFPANPSSWRCGAGCPEWDAGRCLAAGLGPRSLEGGWAG
jgi:hypothetical protein